jgi:hypothetical protein
MVDFKEELIRYSLNEDGYFLHIVAKNLPQLFEKSKAKGIVDLDFSHRHLLKVVTREYNTEKRKYLPYGSKAARCIVSSLLASGQHQLWKEPVKTEDFKTYTSKAFEEYASKKGVDEETVRKLRRLSLRESQVGHMIGRGWFKSLYDVYDDKIRPKCVLRNVISPNV